MKIVVLSSCNVVGQGFIERLHPKFPVSAVLRARIKPISGGVRSKLHSLVSGKFIRSLEQRLFYRRRVVTNEALMASLLGQNQCGLSSPPHEIIDLDWQDVNHERTAERLHELAPDVLVTCCAPILKPNIFSIPKLAAINIHFGISPHYRGENTIFWPLYFRDYSRIGVTIHRIDRGIDTGAVMAQGFLGLEPKDCELQLWVKAIKLASEMMATVLQSPDFPHGGEPQVSSGRFFPLRARRIWHDLLYDCRRATSEKELPKTIERCEFFQAARNENSTTA